MGLVRVGANIDTLAVIVAMFRTEFAGPVTVRAGLVIGREKTALVGDALAFACRADLQFATALIAVCIAHEVLTSFPESAGLRTPRPPRFNACV